MRRRAPVYSAQLDVRMRMRATAAMLNLRDSVEIEREDGRCGDVDGRVIRSLQTWTRQTS